MRTSLSTFRTIGFVSVLVQFLMLTSLPAQQPVYPVIFLHGLNSEDGTWSESIEFYRDAFGWDDPYPNDQGIFHALLNADDVSTLYTDDVVTSFPNHQNVLFAGNIYAINFKNWWDPNTGELKKRQNRPSPTVENFSQSHESAIVKQGYALGLLIRKVLDVTGADKVILVGHSMGGLAAREYLQRSDKDGNPKWWAFPLETAGHRVAKLVTIGTPHAGSNMTEFGYIAINQKSEASRDLTYNYSKSGPPNFGNDPDNGVYLFGGDEATIPVNQWPNPLLGFLNNDVDCDGILDDAFSGINSNTVIRFDNTSMQLPRDVDYTWIVSNWLSNGDGAVRTDRQYLNSVGDTLMIDKFHTGQPSDKQALIEGMDESDTPDFAFEIQADKTYHVFSTRQPNNGNIDVDWLKYTPVQSAAFRVEVRNAPNSNPNRPVRLSLYNANDLGQPFLDVTAQPFQSRVELNGAITSIGDIYIRIETEKDDNSWQNPMFVTWRIIGPPVAISLAASSSSMPALPGSQVTLTAEIVDSQGQRNSSATKPVTFEITSGAGSATLVGNTTVTAVDGVATIQMQATTVPGLVTVQATSPGLQAGTTIVNVYGNPTEVSGNITANTTWTLSNSPYILKGEVVVKSGAVLTIEPGVVVRGKTGTDIYVDGGLIADGTANLPIIFEGADQSLPGTWGGIRFQSSAVSSQCILDYCRLRHGARGGYGNNSAPISLSAYVDPTITNTILEDNNTNGIRVDNGTYTSNIRLGVTGLPYYLNGDLLVEASAVMTIVAGAVIKMWTGSDISIKGGMIAEGDPSNRIVFTSYRDDSYLGDTNGDGNSSGVTGDWGGIGLYASLDDANTRLAYLDVHFAARGGYGNHAAPIYLELAANPSITNVRLFDNNVNGIRLQTGTFSSDVRIMDYDLPMIVPGDIAIDASAKLTIDPGVVLKLWPKTDFYINGTLDARGTASDPIIFTSYRDDTILGDTNGDGVTTGVTGDYGGIDFTSTSSGSQLEYVIMHYAGVGGYGNVGSPLQMSARAGLSVKNVTLNSCTSNGLNIAGGSYSSNIKLDQTDLPYTIKGDIAVTESAALAIAPGTRFKMWPKTDFFIYGELTAIGTEQDSIVLTSYRDDTVDGDTNNDGQSAGVRGDWGGILFQRSAAGRSEVAYMVLRYGAVGGYGNNYGAIVCDAASPRVSHTSFEFTNYSGVYCINGASPDLGGGLKASPGGNRFTGFLGDPNRYAVNNGSFADIFARKNDWETTNSSTIAANIYDKQDRSDRGQVFYEPFVGQPDTYPPQVVITAPQNNAVIGGLDFTVQGTASDNTGEIVSGVDSVEISFNSGAWTPVVNTGTDFSTWSYQWSNYQAGRHTLQARAKDRNANEKLSAIVNVTVNFNGPTIASLQIDPNPTKAGTFTVTITFADGDGLDPSALPQVTFSPLNDTTRFDVSQTSFSGFVWTGTAQITANMANGTATLHVSGVRDIHGNEMLPIDNAGILLIDTAPPQVEKITVAPNPSGPGEVTATVVFRDTSGIDISAAPMVSFIPASGISKPFKMVRFDSLPGTWYGNATVDSTIGDGVASMSVSGAKDRAGNVMAPVQNVGSFLIDVAPPQPFALLAPADSFWTREQQPDLQWAASSDATTGLAKYRVFLNDNLTIPELGPDVTSAQPAVPLADAAYQWHVEAVDSVENARKSGTRVFSIDTTPPVTTITSPAEGDTLAETVAITGTAGDGTGIGVDSVWVSTDSGATWHPATSTAPGFSKWQFTWTFSESGPATLASRSRDRLGNPEIPGPGVIVQRRNSAPWIATLQDTTVLEDSQFTLHVAATDPNTNDTLRFADDSPLFEINPVSGSIDFTPANDDVGQHTVTISVSDGQLTASSQFTLTVQNTNDPPEAFALLSPPNTAAVDTLTPTLRWQQALDIDLGDSVRYQMHLSTRADFADTLLLAQTRDTTHTVSGVLQSAQTYFWKAIARDLAGAERNSERAFSFTVSDMATSVADRISDQIPTTFGLSQNYPNPFNPETRIRFQLPHASHVRIDIFNIMGQHVATLIDEKRVAGYYELLWDGRSEHGVRVASGVYIVAMHAASSTGQPFLQTRKVVVVE